MAILLEDHGVEAVRRFVEAAVLAPSAENSQPWRFVVEADSLTVYLDTMRVLASDVGHMLSFTALGAAIENAVLAASTEGLQAEVELIAEPVRSQPMFATIPIARIHFRDGGHRDPLADYIKSRVTVRRMDPERRVSRELLSELETCCEADTDVEVHWVDEARLGAFARLVGLGNRIRFEHAPFHRELYDNLRFNAAEARRMGDGLDVATLQLPGGVATVLWALRSWPRMKWANVLGFSRGVARQAAREVCGSGAVGFLTVNQPVAKQFIDGGRAFERIWLTASSLGLRVHPTASLPVFLAHARMGCAQLLPRHARLATAMTEQFDRLFPEATGKAVQIAFRLGFGPVPPTRSLRRKPESVLDLP